MNSYGRDEREFRTRTTHLHNTGRGFFHEIPIEKLSYFSLILLYSRSLPMSKDRLYLTVLFLLFLTFAFVVISGQADLLELIVCGNIVGLDIPVRVVQQELWRTHILETTADDYSSDCEAEVGR